MAALPDDARPTAQAALAAEVGAGRLPERVDAPGHEVVVVPTGSAEEAVHRTLQLVTDSIPRTFGVDLAQVQVVTAAPDGPAGAAELNAVCKARFNPGPGLVGAWMWATGCCWRAAARICARGHGCAAQAERGQQHRRAG